MAGHAPPLLLLANKRRMSTRVWPHRYSVGFFRGRLSERIATGREARDVQHPKICGAQDLRSNALARLERPFSPQNTTPFSSIALAHLQARSFRRRRCFLMLLL